MTIDECLCRVDGLKPNPFTRAEKLGWLNALEGMIKAQILDTHMGPEVSFTPYDPDTPGDTVLLVGKPWEDMYLHWLESRMDYYSGDIARYNNAVQMFQSNYDGFSAQYNREHLPKGRGWKYF